MSIEVIIPSWNGRSLLGPCLDALYAQTRSPDRVVVVDNGSTDDTAAWLDSRHPTVRVIRLPVNVGFAGAAQAGALESRAECVAFLNNDARPCPRWLEAADTVFRWDEVGSCASVILTPQGTVESAGLRWTAWGVGRRCMQGIGLERLPVDTVEVFGASGGAALYRREAFLDAGGFDPAYFAQDEDIDLALRLRHRGHACLVHPGARVLHLGGQTLSRTPGLCLRLAQRNLEWAFWYNTPWAAWPVLGLLHVAYQSASLARHALLGRGLPVVRAKYEALRVRPSGPRTRPGLRMFIRHIAPWLKSEFRPWRGLVNESW